LKLVLMIEGQEGVSWDEWVALARAAEEHELDALLRSDHYHSVDDRPERGGALDAWGTICALAAVTDRIKLGTLVSPVTFRPPAVLAKLALTADHVSRGRVQVGFGTGWWQAEHERFGFDFPPLGERMDELERQLEAVQRLWRETEPAPVQQPRPHVMMGGAAKPRGARLAALWADEYNVLGETPDACRAKRAALDRACEKEGRDPGTLTMSVMCGFVIGADEADLRERRARMAEWRGSNEIRPDWLYGTVEQVRERVGEYEAAGVDRVVFQHHLFRDLDAVALIGSV
jgi:alkanesulfonate monooxygenase SsuD/methylene tetrahydromethanopterin reductase-like flavin-dependent oxidoreductase (luciferase family)